MKLNNISNVVKVALGLLFLALALALISTGLNSLHGWFSFYAVLLGSAGFLWLGWVAVQSESPPKWLLVALVGAALLRLAFGVFWFLALPEWGYDTPVQTSGYIMKDANDRDGAAWQLSQSETPLLAAFQDYSAADQYGGLLFLSGFVYRYFGSNYHQPLLMIVITAAFSSLATLFTWAFAKRIWGHKAARVAAWFLVLYPEAILIGSSQMREAFMITLAAAAFYGLIRFWSERSRTSLAWALLPLAIIVPLSIPFAILLVGGLVLSLIALDEWRVLKLKRFWLAIGGIGVLLLVGNTVDLIALEKLWPFQAARWQTFYSESASGWVQRTFERFPDGMEWAQIPFLVGYGVFRPLLPASFFDGIPIMRGIAIWRALGWTILLAMLFYSTFLLLRDQERRKLTGGLILLTWIIVIIASLRGGGDQWDNPRYRSVFAGIQVGLAGWALVKQDETEDPWFRRTIVGTLLMVAWFIPWYLRRYTPISWPVVALHQTIGFGLISGILYVIWDWVRFRDHKSG